MLHDETILKLHAAAYDGAEDDGDDLNEIDALDDEEEEELSSAGELHAEEAEIYAAPPSTTAPYEPATHLSTPPVAAPAPVVKAPAKKKAV